MKLYKKLAYLASMAVLALGTVACNDSDDYTAASVEKGDQVYFSSAAAASAFYVDESQSEVTVQVIRKVADEPLSVPVLADINAAFADLFTVPATVNFATGQEVTELTISFDRAALEDGAEYPISLLLNDAENTTAYGLSEITLIVSPWPWQELGTGKFRDGWFVDMYGVDPFEIDVKIHESKTKPGYYMVEDMFGWNYLTTYFGGEKAAIEARYLTYSTRNIEINAMDPNEVFIPQQSSGINMINGGYGDIVIATAAAGKMEEGIITFPAQGLILFIYGGEGGQGMYGNQTGAFRLMLPGIVATDYSLSASYAGMFVAPDNVTATAKVNLTYGPDITGLTYTFVQGDVTADPSAAVAGIMDGSDENAVEIEALDESGAMTIDAALEDSGVYTLVLVGKDKDGVMSEEIVAAISFFFPGLGGNAAPECEIAVTLDLVSNMAPDASAQYPDASSLCYLVTGSELKVVKTIAATTAQIEGILASGATMQDIMDVNGKENAKIVEKITAEGAYLGVFSGLQQGTSYTIIVEGENVYGSKTLVYSTCSTATVAYEGSLEVGEYTLTCESYDSESLFTLNPVEGDETKFTVGDLGIENGAQWHAVYDEAAGTLTLDGTELGYEDYGNQFGTLYGYYDADKTMGYGLFSGTGSPQNEPLVFNVTNNQISSLEVSLIVGVFDLTNNNAYLGAHAAFDAGSPVVKGDATTGAPAKVKTAALNVAAYNQSLISKPGRNLRSGMRQYNETSINAGVRTVSVDATVTAGTAESTKEFRRAKVAKMM